MILKYLSLVFFVFGLFSGCSDKDSSSSEQNKLPTSNVPKVLKTAIPPSSNERGVKKIIPILEESHNHCKGEAQYNECFCKKSNFSGTVTIGNTKYHCR